MLSQNDRTKLVYKQYNFCLNRKSEAELIDHLDSIPNKRQFFVQKIREDMKQKGEKD